MADQIIEKPQPEFLARFSDWLHADPRPGFSGYLLDASHLLEIAQTLHDEYGYDYLSQVTAIDHFPEDKMEVVYYFYRTTGGGPVILKIQTGRNEPSVPSLVKLYPGAELQEREIWDMFGIRFDGHPDLRRLLMWEGFAGHPLRKDYHEPYYEEEVKPFKSRWPDGHAVRSETKTPYNDNVQFPAEFNPETWVPDGDQSLYSTIKKVESESRDGMAVEQMIINLGPQHPSTHGVFRMVALLEGETVVDLKPVVGYLHRNHEKIGERNTFIQNIPYTDRLDYISSMSNNFGYVLAVEKLMGIVPPERAEYLRVMMAEFTRIISHAILVGFLLNDLGAFYTPNLYALEERELILDIFEAVSGSRMMCNYFRFGGVVRDLPEGILEKAKALILDRLPRKIDELDAYLTNNEILRERCEGVGILTAEQAIQNSAAGPVLRASGVPYDVRRADPYSIYDRLDFDVAVRYHGDVYDRYLIRLDEIRQSLRILRQIVKDIPEGPVMASKPQYQVRVPAGEAYGRVEGPKGELGFYVISNGKPNPQRYHVRAPSLINLTSLAQMAKGYKIADAVITLGSLDIVLGEVDR